MSGGARAGGGADDDDGDDQERALGAVAAMLVGVAAVSAAAIFIRKAGVPPLACAFWRCFLAALVMLPVVVVRGEAWPRGADLRASVAAGAALALHFALWIASLESTTVAASVVLVCTQPVFVVVLAWLVLRERTPRAVAAGIAVALVGVVLIALDGEGLRGAAFRGNALALAGAVAIAVYVLVGRAVDRDRVGLLAYSTVVYGVAALLLAPASLLFGEALVGYDATSWAWLAALTALPQLLGHTALNYALRRLPASLVSGSILGEPVVSTALAWAFLDEVPGALTLAGGGVVLGGLVLLVRGAPGR